MEECDAKVLNLNTRIYYDAFDHQNCTDNLISERTNLANCLAHNVGLRFELEDLNSSVANRGGTSRREFFTRNCYESCTPNPDCDGAQCEKDRDNCILRCQIRVAAAEP